MTNMRYYQNELEYLRQRAAEFSRAHPAVAPLLSGPSSDPDVERLLEGTAFLAGLLSRQLDESYDRLAENLLELVLPQLLRDIPSCTVMQFTPKPSLAESVVIPRGSRVGSTDVDGVSCIFSTTCPVTLAPMRLEAVALDKRPGRQASLRLDFAMTFPPAFQGLKYLRLHLRGGRPGALGRLYYLLAHTEQLVFQSGQTRRVLAADSLRPAGFAPEDALFPYPPTALPGYRLLQEYFIFPEKFFFLDIPLPDMGVDKKGLDAFSCTLALRQSEDEAPSFSQDSFALFVTPAVNLFPYETIPIRVDHRQDAYPVRANTSKSEAYNPYLVTSVKSVGPNGEKKFTQLLPVREDQAAPSYKMRCRGAENGRREIELYLSYPQDAPLPEAETLSLDVLYSNGALPARLNSGDVRLPLSSSPALADFSNLTPPTNPVPPPAEGNVLWAMLAHLYLNYLPLADAGTLRSLLFVYLPEKTSSLHLGANKKRIDSIVSLEAKAMDYLWKGRPVRGTDILLTLDESGFSNIGDMHLFSMVLASFIHEYSAINSFVRVTVTDTLGKHRFQWLKHMKDLMQQ
ncbi:MAG: type VI secretion system baseplate subunit TssF [Desulfovibrio sp.]|jgi:type VI secretion system protein ImpG|nr:type VI secretion system baseplate subunit TssF [Desulfovibrio sp.]